MKQLVSVGLLLALMIVFPGFLVAQAIAVE